MTPLLIHLQRLHNQGLHLGLHIHGVRPMSAFISRRVLCTVGVRVGMCLAMCSLMHFSAAAMHAMHFFMHLSLTIVQICMQLLHVSMQMFMGSM